MAPGRMVRACFAGVLVLGALIFVSPSAANAAPTTTTSTVNLSGSSDEQAKLHIEAFCDECMPDDLFICGDGCEVAAGGKLDVFTKVRWSAPVTVDTVADPEELVQGTSPDVTSTLTPGEGSITIDYRLPYQVGLFARNGDFPPGPDWSPTAEYTLIDEFNVSTSAPCTPLLTGDGTGTCSVTDTINLLPETCFFDLCPVDITINLVVNHEFTIGPSGIVAHRVTTFSPATDLTVNGPTPGVVTEPLAIPCDAAVGTDVNYALSGFDYSPNVSVAGTSKIVFDIDGPGPLNAAPELDLLSGNVFSTAPVNMSSTDTASAFLGDVLLDNIAPSISAVFQGGTFVEGSDVDFSTLTTDNCADGLTYSWTFSDGGIAFGNDAHHAFDDDGTGYTGHVVAQDAAGNSDVYDFNVHAIANANPIPAGPPNAAADWGVPMSFHADAVDPGPADQPTLQFSWNFGDGAGAAGQDVVHSYAAPGVYAVTITVFDKDGGVGVTGLNVSISPRETTLVYTGDTQALPNHYTTLSATLSDEYGQPVIGRTVNFTLGSQTASAVTNSSGVASVSLRLDQKKGTYSVAASFAGDTLYVASSTPSINYVIGNS